MTSIRARARHRDRALIAITSTVGALALLEACVAVTLLFSH